jgi:hypothetical protein
MERIEKTVFISYRCTNIPWAHAIFQNLTNNGYDVLLITPVSQVATSSPSSSETLKRGRISSSC